MNNFTDGAPIYPKNYLDKGLNITPCRDKKPIVPNWNNKKLTLKEWQEYKLKYFQIGLILNGIIDFDIDNHFINRFVGKYLKSCGAVYGREGNPLSHYLFEAEENIKPYKFMLPKELESYYKHFSHGSCLCEIRTGNNFQSLVPGSKINKEDVRWNKFAGINSYPGHLKDDISKIALSGALGIVYPSKGARDNYCTAIAGVLSNHTNWSGEEINEFVYNLAINSGDENAHKKMNKGTNAKKSKGNKLGMPTIAEIVGCSVQTISKLFSWVGVKDSGSLFTALRCYMIEPKYWQLKYKDTWITFYDTAILLSYTKIKILVLENCLEESPEMTPPQWKEVRTGLLKEVVKIETPHEASYYGNMGVHFITMLTNTAHSDKLNLGMHHSGTWLNPEDNHYYFRLENFLEKLKRYRLSFEMRRLTHWLRETFEAEPCKITIDKKEMRVWKVALDVIANHELNNVDIKAALKLHKKKMDKVWDKIRKQKEEIPF